MKTETYTLKGSISRRSGQGRSTLHIRFDQKIAPTKYFGVYPIPQERDLFCALLPWDLPTREKKKHQIHVQTGGGGGRKRPEQWAHGLKFIHMSLHKKERG
ncbi:UNVERIFIED_CONTAM: hypothetical protein K2H54_008948 [Gekko kuhli]